MPTFSVSRQARHARWFILAASLVVILVTTGPRQSYSVFIEPLTAELGWSRTAVVLPYALLTLFWGLIQPVAGRLIDLYGPRAIVLVSVIIGGLVFISTAFVTELWQMILLFSIIYSVAVAGGGPIALTVLLAPWFGEQQRAKVFAACYAIMPASVFIFAPLAFTVINGWGWRYAFIVLGLLILVGIPVTLFGLRELNPPVPSARDKVWAGFLTRMLHDSRVAFRFHPFLYLSLAFFACGFTSIFFLGQLAVVATAYGFTPSIGAIATALAGIVSGVGTIACGVLADRYPRANVLAVTYFVRGLGFLSLAVLTIGSPLIFYAVVSLIAFALFGTAPSTNALVYEMFRGRGAGMLLGLVFVLHQVGGFSGMLLGGLLFDLLGNYAVMFWLSFGLMIFATIMSLRAGKLLKETPLATP